MSNTMLNTSGTQNNCRPSSCTSGMPLRPLRRSVQGGHCGFFFDDEFSQRLSYHAESGPAMVLLPPGGTYLCNEAPRSAPCFSLGLQISPSADMLLHASHLPKTMRSLGGCAWLALCSLRERSGACQARLDQAHLG
eukprot:4725215-Amphidinium_carterae.1